MAWSYIRLWKLLLDKGMKRIDLAAAAHLTPNTLASLGKNKEVSMETLNKICNQLDCRIEDILEHIPDWNIDRGRTTKCRDFRLRSIFLGTMFFEIFKVYWFFQRLLQLQSLTSKNAYILHLLFSAFQSIIILYICTNFVICICTIRRRFRHLKNHENPCFCNQTPYVISIPDFMISGKP